MEEKTEVFTEEEKAILKKHVTDIDDPEGIIVLNTPNIGSLFAKTCGKRWWNLMGMHIFYFDKKTIRKVLEKNGYDVIKIKSYSRTIILKYAIEWLKTYNIVYNLFKIVQKPIGDLKIKVNTFDNMMVFARKK